MNSTNQMSQGPSIPSTHYGIRQRLILGFSAVVFVFIMSAMVTLYFIRDSQNDTSDFMNRSMPTQHAMVDLMTDVADMQLYVQSYVLLHDVSAKAKIDKKITTIDKLISQLDTQVKEINDDNVSRKWDKVTRAYIDYKQKLTSVFTMVDGAAIDKTTDLYKMELLPLSLALNDAFNLDTEMEYSDTGLINSVNNHVKIVMSDINKQLDFIFMGTLIFIVLALIVSYLIASYTSRSILNPIMYAIDIARQIASGKRDIDIVINKNDETGLLLGSLSSMLNSIKASETKIKEIAEDNKKLYDSVVKAANLFSKHASRVAAGELSDRLDLEGDGIQQDVMIRLGKDLNHMTDNLSSVTNDIIQACSSMVTTLDEVRHAVDAQSSGASEQASSINQITASITEIEKSATQTMTKAKDLGGVAEKTRQSGQLGLESIESSVLGMKSVRDRVQIIAQTILDLSRQTQQVGEITAVVNNLAQQSKMLALNASIEAAKAGDAGKGFAVVAAEVKNLAEQSEQSTSQVQKILEDIRIATEKAVMVTEEGTKGVDSGLQMIERTGDVIRDLNDVIREASIASQQIEAAVRQESAGIEQITAGMNEINTVTSSFVESVSQTTEAMDNLSNVTKKLKSSVETYKI